MDIACFSRCQNPSIDQPAVIVSLRSKDTGSALDERSSEIALNVHTVEARVTPAVQKEMHALLLAVFSAVAARTSSSTGICIGSCLLSIHA